MLLSLGKTWETVELRTKREARLVLMLLKRSIAKLQNRNKEFRFPKVSIYQAELKNDLWSELETDAQMFSDIQGFDLSDFGAWKNQMRRDSELNFDPSLNVFIDDLVGVRGMASPTESDLESYYNYFKSHPNFHLNFRKLRNQIENTPLILADLGSILDVLEIESLFSKMMTINVLEIGGGYGRLALSVLENRGQVKQWNMVDIVPSSLALAHSYLTLNGHSPSFSFKDSSIQNVIRLLQISRIHMIEDDSIDLFVNIESFQEMTQEWVNFWVEVINRKAKKGAFFYHSNSFNYKNEFEITLGPSWELVRSIDSPRHWTTGHRTEIWKKN